MAQKTRYIFVIFLVPVYKTLKNFLGTAIELNWHLRKVLKKSSYLMKLHVVYKQKVRYHLLPPPFLKIGFTYVFVHVTY